MYFVVPLVALIIWFAFGYYRDDASAIESLQSVESENANRETDEEIVRRSKSSN